MIIAIASGKGGTGKTTIATSLAVTLIDSGCYVSFLDCDVEAPNAHLFLQPEFNAENSVTLPVPLVNLDLCSACGRCAEVCQFNAIIVLGSKPLVIPELCHGCGSCTLECPEGAIIENPHQIGLLEGGVTSEGIKFGRGVLNVGQPMAVPIITKLKKWLRTSNMGVTVLDCPPGASCPVVASLRGTDFALLVTEPTPFGLHDLKQAVQLTRELNIPAGVIINRNDIGDNQVDDYCQNSGLPVLMRIPFSQDIGRGIAMGKTLIDICPEYRSHFIDLYRWIGEIIIQEGAKK
jgi:MinD superfamily P-loop ATPase